MRHQGLEPWNPEGRGVTVPCNCLYANGTL
ncbi:hypothetical protein PI27_gp009 [Listeria phage WIL-1]|nr:hypothetical protein PI27_gp009 [Listeria phage WIL-1]